MLNQQTAEQVTETIKMENLVALIYANNECYTNVVELSEVDQRPVTDPIEGPWTWPKLVVDLEEGVWYQEGETPAKIGRAHFRHHFGGSILKYGLIGVYDRTNIRHLNTMVSNSKEATEDRNRYID
jgi:hypothetical protein